jgi:hypothetical protein
MLAWLWRLALACVLTTRLARLDLSLVPTHPDGAGGLGFLETLPVAFSPVVFALSAVLASRWAHEVMYHGVHVAELRMPMIAFAVIVVVLFLAPLVPFLRPLAAARRRAQLEYAALVARHGRGRRSLLAVLLPAALPLLPVLAIEVPIGDLLMKVMKTLV